jgi:hypothetical protein
MYRFVGFLHWNSLEVKSNIDFGQSTAFFKAHCLHRLTILRGNLDECQHLLILITAHANFATVIQFGIPRTVAISAMVISFSKIIFIDFIDAIHIMILAKNHNVINVGI